MTNPDRDLDRDVAGAAAAHQRLLTTLDEALADGRLDVARPSRLPDWTVGHVLTHLARNADSMVRVLEAAGRGEVVDRYPGGTAGRNAEIEAGHARPATEQVDDVRRTIWRLDQAWAAPPHEAWEGRGREASGSELAVRYLPAARRREVEVHLVDLDIGAEPDGWPTEFVRLELREMEMRWNARRPMGITGLPPEALAAAPHDRLAWLYGRLSLPGLGPAGVM
ncbi:MAG: maleylpyruvate isomerase family mycothiol-dependent enzyme [Ilumatobacteraceae bacterium]